MKTVVVSQRIDYFAERKEVRDALDQRLVTFIKISGGLPIPIPNILFDSIDEWLQIIKPEAVVLSGGNNIGEFKERDLIEFTLLDYAKKNSLPLLGICRGMQIMGYWAGTNVRKANGHVHSRHQLQGTISFKVNSFHDFVLSECPAGFDVLARSEDGEIEAIRHKHLLWEGWMWHPERESEFSTHDIERLKGLLK